jgi:hypothetical protein
MKRKKWTVDEIELLKNLYSETQNLEISKQLNRTINSVVNNAVKLGLYKSKTCRGRLIGKRNKLIARDLSYDLVKQIAAKYKTKSEFIEKDSSAYQTARRAGYLNEICSHMINTTFSIPQLILKNILDGLLNSKSLYNTRQIIKPYEIDVFFPKFNLAFEYQGKRWHLNNKKDNKKRTLFTEKNINIIYIVENTRDYENDIKNQLTSHLEKINTICNTNLTNDDIFNFKIDNPYKSVYNIDDLFAIAQKYTSYSEFRKKEFSAYNKLRKLKLVDAATKHITDKKISWDVEKIKEKIKKYTLLKDLIEQDFGVYSYIKRNKLEYLIHHLLKRQYKHKLKYTIDNLQNELKKYKTILEFRTQNPKMYDFIIRHKLQEHTTNLIK